MGIYALPIEFHIYIPKQNIRIPGVCVLTYKALETFCDTFNKNARDWKMKVKYDDDNGYVKGIDLWTWIFAELLCYVASSTSSHFLVFKNYNTLQETGNVILCNQIFHPIPSIDEWVQVEYSLPAVNKIVQYVKKHAPGATFRWFQDFCTTYGDDVYITYVYRLLAGQQRVFFIYDLLNMYLLPKLHSQDLITIILSKLDLQEANLNGYLVCREPVNNYTKELLLL